ncbi:DUF2934 domain-containing protein [Pseudomonas sp. ZM23]|uniref:DUF2934 domain-containing protein n=1 Tax=Pseudomonas triclosanedens TaxID=2961893 RepID=A0ABY7A7P1_9PSED|nr:DUF2934 domain-containing protein [Pseudomonas triclosanedens]MCP8466262.1 DUF2934 domain-containing protein [Pseudomonas triclosanedens]MCP8471788.1 DUF2934 domain-containing protein [Pseudomonas triclosanedens]MCP8478483.1 DUF2934 domain-containing protein [Pseudomonas triclosanedens]WAI52320.1 DUF2934 domain-containing protein [Pseudomonas triclosanedens]
MKVSEQRVRELAYQIWESEGRPEGQQERHWRMALSLAEGEIANGQEAPAEDVEPRFEGREEPEPPAILQKPPRRRGKLPAATPEEPSKPALEPRNKASAAATPGEKATKTRPKTAKPATPKPSRAPKSS